MFRTHVDISTAVFGALESGKLAVGDSMVLIPTFPNFPCGDAIFLKRYDDSTIDVVVIQTTVRAGRPLSCAVV